MSQYRFVGTSCEIWDTPYKFTRFGQLVDMPDDLAKSAIASGAALMPASDFDALGFAPDELKKYAKVPSHAKAPASFLSKRDAAWVKLHAPTPVAVPTPTPVPTAPVTPAEAPKAEAENNTVKETK
jgi:hypothetical protein